jgi:hypothetical protein
MPKLTAEPLMLRRPGLAFGLLALALLYIVALAVAAFAAGGLGGFDLGAAEALSLPAALGTALAALRIGPPLRRGAFAHRRDVVWRAMAAFGAIGFAWPLSFGIAALSQGDHAPLLAVLAPAVFGLFVGAIGGALGGLATAFACCIKRA